jgi:hypothetical protein
MRLKCKNIACPEWFTPSKANRGYGGCCSKECQRSANGKHGFTAYASATPGAPVFGASVNRRHGADRKAQTE